MLAKAHCDTRPASKKSGERETPPLDGKSCKVTLQRSEARERATNTAVFAISPPELPSPGTLVSVAGGENQAFMSSASIPDDSAKSPKDRPRRAPSTVKAHRLPSAIRTCLARRQSWFPPPLYRPLASPTEPSFVLQAQPSRVFRSGLPRPLPFSISKTPFRFSSKFSSRW